MSIKHHILGSRHLAHLFLPVILVFVCENQLSAAAETRTAPSKSPALKDAYEGAFLIGAALNTSQVDEADPTTAGIVRTHFNSITPENLLKWERVHPEPKTYDFKPADRFVAFGEKNGMHIVGHTLVWHNQTPAWVFQDASGKPAGRDVVLGRMREHIQKVVGRYKGRIKSWDVVNEAIDEDGSMRQSPWLETIGEDYIEKAFTFAHEADPGAELLYNDYSLTNTAKRKGVVALIKKLKAAGVPVSGVGMQQHIRIDHPSASQIEAAITDFAALGVSVMVTELDIDVLPSAWEDRGADITLNVELQDRLNPYRSGLPDSVQQSLAHRYAEVFAAYYKHRDAITRVTFWGVTDAGSWLNNWPVRGRTSYPLLFDRDGDPKPAFDAVIRVVQPAR